MSDILAAIGSAAATDPGAVQRPPPTADRPEPRQAAPDTNSGAERAAETRRVAERQKEAESRFQVRIHSETLRVITEIVDMVTGETLMYLPAGYRPNAKPAEPAPDTAAEPEPRRKTGTYS